MTAFLLPCPFCGLHLLAHQNDPDDPPAYWIHPDNLDPDDFEDYGDFDAASCPLVFSTIYPTDVTAWNRRANPITADEFRALGYGFGAACAMLDTGTDPRAYEFPRLVADWRAYREKYLTQQGTQP